MKTQTRREFVRLVFAASQAVLAARFLPTPLLGQLPQAAALNFLVFGDWGRKGGKEQVEVAAQMVVASKAINPKFIISVGDNFYTNGVESTQDPQWKSSFEDVYKDPSLQMPWYSILGNHDYRGNCDAQIDYSKTSKRWKMPARYYMQTEQVDAAITVDFFYIDTNPFLKSYAKDPAMSKEITSQDVAKQVAWLKAGLAASKAQWKIVVGHHPIYSGGEHGDTKELIEQVLPLLYQYGVQVYFNGHDHDLEHLVAGKLHLFDSGAGSQVRPTKPNQYTKFTKGNIPGFTAIALSAEKMDVRMIDNNGAVLYNTTVPRIPV